MREERIDYEQSNYKNDKNLDIINNIFGYNNECYIIVDAFTLKYNIIIIIM